MDALRIISLLSIIMLASSDVPYTTDNELYVNFEPLPGQGDSWPVARAIHVQFRKRMEDGRELRHFDNCRVLQSPDSIASEASRTPKEAIRKISKEEFDSIEGRCERMEELERTVWGTKWCGAGNEAEDDEDLGYFNNVDACCRDHDKCDNIAAGQTKYGYQNSGQYTLMNCVCEDAFKKCLDNIKGFWSSKAVAAVKSVYFDLYGNGCYNKKCPSGRSERSEQCTAEYTGESGLGAKFLNWG